MSAASSARPAQAAAPGRRPEVVANPYSIDTVGNALRILLMLRDRESVRVTDVSRELGVARSTAHRLLTTMTEQGFVRRHPTRRVYQTGHVLVEIGLAAVGNLDVRRVAHAHLADLADALDETVNLMVLTGGQARFIDGVEGSQPVRVGTRTGVVMPAHATSGGKVLLADLPADDVRSLYARGVPSVTRRTIGRVDRLLSELEEVRRQGYALNISESEVGLHAIAVPIRTSGTGAAVAALAVATPALRMTRPDVTRLVAALQASAERIGAELLLQA